MSKSKSKGQGWHDEPGRHADAARGIPTAVKHIRSAQTGLGWEEDRMTRSGHAKIQSDLESAIAALGGKNAIPPLPTSSTRAVDIVADTVDARRQRRKDAYSYETSYDPLEWKRIARWLVEKGYPDWEVKEILRSKHMHWASDMTTPGYPGGGGQMTLERFKEYYNAPRIKGIIRAMLERKR